MKSLTVLVAALVVTLILNGPIQSYAVPQMDTLVNIATQARDNLNVSISQIPNVPSEVTSLYQQGSAETDALTKAASAQDIVSAKQHFLSAMNFFKQTNDKISSLGATETSDQQRSDVTKLQSEIKRLNKIAGTLRTIAIANHVDFDFTPFDTSIQQAKQALFAGKIDDASKSIDAANQLIVNAHDALSETAQKITSDRAKDFTEKQVARFDKLSPPLNTTQPSAATVSNVTAQTTAPSSTSAVENPGEMIAKLRKLVAEGNVDEALKIIKSLDAYQKETEQNQNAAQPVQNNTNPSPVSQPNSIAPPISSNSTQSIPSSASSNSTQSIPSSVPPVNSESDNSTTLPPPPIVHLQTNSSSVPPTNLPNATANNSVTTNPSNNSSDHEGRDGAEHDRVIPQTADVQNTTNLVHAPTPIPPGVLSGNSSNASPTNSSNIPPNSHNVSDQIAKNKKTGKSAFRIMPPQGNSVQQGHSHDKKSHEQTREKPRQRQNRG